MNLSEHFTLEQLIFSETALRLDIDNVPNALEIEKLRWLASYLDEVWDVIGPFHVTSGFRCLALNRALRSSDTSQHVRCEAADCQSADRLTPLEMCRRVSRSLLPFDQCIYEFQAWMHISFTQGSPRGMLLTIDRTGARQGLPA